MGLVLQISCSLTQVLFLPHMSLSCSSFAIDDHRFKLIGALSATITAFMFVNNDVDLQIQSEANSMKTKVLDQSYLLVIFLIFLLLFC
ncbi:unnamed protein product [Camellia sinensis]